MERSTDTVVNCKQAIRSEMISRRRSMSRAERLERSLAATTNLCQHQLWTRTRSIALFHSMDEEIETRFLLEAAWRSSRLVALPVTPKRGLPLEFRLVTASTPLVRTRYGVFEPTPSAPSIDPAELDLLVVPGLAFDIRGARLGYGGGYYDRTLAGCGPAVLLAFSCQHVDQVPEEPHDQRVSAIVTDTGWVRPQVRGRPPEPTE